MYTQTQCTHVHSPHANTKACTHAQVSDTDITAAAAAAAVGSPLSHCTAQTFAQNCTHSYPPRTGQ